VLVGMSFSGTEERLTKSPDSGAQSDASIDQAPTEAGDVIVVLRIGSRDDDERQGVTASVLPVPRQIC